VGISRSALVERFTRYLSEPPMTYLTRWRLPLAARSLERTSRGVAEIAADVGYESEAAFNRAFKREFGQPPGRYRSDHKSSPTKKASDHLRQEPRLIVNRDCRCDPAARSRSRQFWSILRSILTVCRHRGPMARDAPTSRHGAEVWKALSSDGEKPSFG
jgi:hypothetical protein